MIKPHPYHMQRYQLGPRMNPLIIYMDSVEVTLHFKPKSCFQWRFQYKSFFYQFLLCLHLSLSPSRAEFLLYAATRLLCKRYIPSPASSSAMPICEISHSWQSLPHLENSGSQTPGQKISAKGISRSFSFFFKSCTLLSERILRGK